ncbi:MAG: S8 family serine peptidase [Anaerolineae bacterium]
MISSLFAIVSAISLAQGPSPQAPIEAGVWQAMGQQGQADFLIVLDAQADLRPASALPGRLAKGRYVVDALRAVAAKTQPPLVARLRAPGGGATVRPFYIVNALLVEDGDLTALQTAASAPEVAYILADEPARLDLPQTYNPAPQPSRAGSIEVGVVRVNAPLVWSMGYSGSGIVIGGQDTGVRWDHEALINQYRGWDGASADHDYNWHDAVHEDIDGFSNPCGLDSPAPCDDFSHGTHTLGTAVGDDGGANQIGVAPGAQWIACRNMDSGVGRPSTYLECFEWFLAPYPVGGTPAVGDPAKAPHIITNSWSCPPAEECLTGQEVISGVQAMRAAGILTVVAAGNAGPNCSTVKDPPAIYAESFTVGALDSTDIAWFSSRGPVTRDGSNRLKPDIAAPGVNVRSSENASVTDYGYKMGTSMATPHVAGVAALLWDAAPHLVGEVDLTEWVLRLSARPRTTSQGCGGDGPTGVPNNVWGWGEVDALAAVSATLSLTPTAVLTVTTEPVIAGLPVLLDASASTDPETPASLLARWDVDGDGLWDTGWAMTLTATVIFTQTGLQTVTVQIADPGGRVDAASLGVQAASSWRNYFPIIAR